MPIPVTEISKSAQSRFLRLERKPLFYANWLSTFMIHLAVDPDLLQREVPYELDLRDGAAHVSLVAFTIDRLRPSVGGLVAEKLLAPIARHGFHNVRTYVKHQEEPGIYFLVEWLQNRLSVMLGPPTFGLPYRYAHLSYDHRATELRGRVIPGDGHGVIAYEAQLESVPPEPCDGGTRDEFLMERYTAFTQHRRSSRLFRIWHPPWPQVRATCRLVEDSALRPFKWYDGATLVGANYSPGVFDVWLGRPRKIRGDLRYTQPRNLQASATRVTATM